MGPALFSLLRPFSAFKFAVRDVFEPVLWDLLLPDDVTRVGGVFDSITYPLEKAAELIRRRFAPGCTDLGIGMVDELSMFQHFARFELHYGEGRLEHAWRVLATRQLFRAALPLI